VRLRSLSVAMLAGLVLVPVASSAAVAAPPAAGLKVSPAAAKTFKSSAHKRAKRAQRAATAVTAPLTNTTTAPAPAVGPTTAVSYADRVLTLTNQERTSRGLRALSFNSCADGYADSWATSLSVAGALSHQPLSPILSSCSARSVGENVAYGNVTPEQLVAMWMDSAGHRANILNAGFTHLGVGNVTVSSGRVYAVQVFLTK
jgi:uncharacterized protein YkwD